MTYGPDVSTGISTPVPNGVERAAFESGLGEYPPIVTASEIGVDPEALWRAADKLRGSIDAAEYKHVVLGLIFLKYISDAFEARRADLAVELEAEGITGQAALSSLEDRDGTQQKLSFGYRRKRAGRLFSTRPSSLPSLTFLMTPCTRLNAIIQSLRESCHATTHGAVYRLSDLQVDRPDRFDHDWH